MTTTKDAVAAVAQHIGFDPPRVSAVARRMTEAGLLPSGAPRTPPSLEVEHVLALVLGCAIDAPLRAVPAAVTGYLALIPHGADLTGAPMSVPRTAGDVLAVWAEIAINGDADTIRRDRIEVASSWPEIGLHTPRGVARFIPAVINTAAWHWGGSTRFVPIDANAAALQPRFQPTGANPNLWQDHGHRRATTINGAALVDCLQSLFQKEAT